MIGKVISMEDEYQRAVDECYLPDDMKAAMKHLLSIRIASLRGTA